MAYVKSIVSIHAPAWGATDFLRLGRLFNLFQSTLPHGERQFVADNPAGPNSFNPRSRMGSDIVPCTRLDLLTVSIHAPAWGATYQKLNIR